MPICFVVHLFITIVNDGYLSHFTFTSYVKAAFTVIKRFCSRGCVRTNIGR